jgi:hypothetical protein
MTRRQKENPVGNSVSIDTGSSAVRWPSYLAQTSAWLKATDLTSATTCSLKTKGALFTHLTERWKDLFNAKFEILLYDLTSTYFECDPPIVFSRRKGPKF